MLRLRYLFAILVYYRHNLQMIHWKADGDGFDRVHTLAEEYYDKISDFVDSIAEKIIILGGVPMSLEECIETVNNSDREYITISPEADYGRHEAFKGIQIILSDIIKEYNEVLDNDDLPKGMTSSLESDLEWLELECDYKNKKRLS